VLSVGEDFVIVAASVRRTDRQKDGRRDGRTDRQTDNPTLAKTGLCVASYANAL